MNRSDIMDLINEIEETLPVQTWIVDGIHVWPLIRISLAFRLYHSQIESRNTPALTAPLKPVKMAVNVLRGFAKFSQAYLADYKQNRKISQQADVAFFIQTGTRTLIDKVWYDRFSDVFINYLEELNLSNFVIEWAPGREYKLPRYRPSMFVQPSLDFLKIKSRIFTTINNTEITDKKWLNNFKKIPALSSKELIIQLATIRELANFFKKKLNKIKPALGCVVCYYGIEGMAFTLACRELGIVSVDIQHGLQGDLHAAYGRWNCVPQTGYELLPSIFWCWSDREARAIDSWSSKVSQWHQPLVGGNLWLDMWQQESNDLVNQYDNRVLNIKNSDKDSLYILFTLQPIEESSLPNWILQAIQESPPSWIWWMRLHPGMMAERERIRQLLQQCKPANIVLDQASDLPLPALLRHTDVHVTRWSSTVIEAESFGVPSVVTHAIGTEVFPLQMSEGIVIAAHTTMELLDAIRVQTLKKKQLPKYRDSSSLARPAIQSLLERVQQAKHF